MARGAKPDCISVERQDEQTGAATPAAGSRRHHDPQLEYMQNTRRGTSC